MTWNHLGAFVQAPLTGAVVDTLGGTAGRKSGNYLLSAQPSGALTANITQRPLPHTGTTLAP